MNDAIEAIAVGFSVTLIFSVFLGTAAFFRYLRYKETIELAKQGLLRPSRTRSYSNHRHNRWAAVSIAVGMALLGGLISLGFGPWLIVGFLPLFFGIALIVIDKADTYESTPSNTSDEDAELLRRKQNQG